MPAYVPRRYCSSSERICIALRTVRFQDGRAYLQAGGGIVADSVPAEEHQECLNKLAAIEAAIAAAEGAA